MRRVDIFVLQFWNCDIADKPQNKNKIDYQAV